MFENLLKSFTKNIFAKISEKYDADIAALKADVAALKASATNTAPPSSPQMPLYPPSDITHIPTSDTPIFEPSRQANILFGQVSNNVGAFPAGTYQGLTYDFDFEFVARPGIQILSHTNTISPQLSYSNLEVVGEGWIDVLIYQRMYTRTENGTPDMSMPIFINKSQYAALNITKASTEYSAVGQMSGFGCEQMYMQMQINTSPTD